MAPNPDARAVRLDADERSAFLGRGGTGVLSLSTDGGDPPHTLPVSYGYDDVEEVFFFRLAFGPDSGKADASTDAVSFVTYRETDDGWRSVVATGGLEEVTDETMPAAVLEALDRVHIPLVDVFEDPPRTVSFRFFRLDPDDLTGRTEAVTDE